VSFLLQILLGIVMTGKLRRMVSRMPLIWLNLFVKSLAHISSLLLLVMYPI